MLHDQTLSRTTYNPDKTIVLLTVHPSFYVGLESKQTDVTLNQLDCYVENCLITFVKADFFFSLFLQNNFKEALCAMNGKDVVLCDPGP